MSAASGSGSGGAAPRYETVSEELFTLTYGAVVAQVVRDFEDPKEANAQLEAMGYNIGVRIVDDIEVAPDGSAELGRLAALVRDKRIPLELCPSSNVQTGAVPSIDKHPFDLLARLRFGVTVNTDNRLMSDTTMSLEMSRLVDAFGYGWSDLERFTINAMKSAFIHFDERLEIIDNVIKPRYAVLVG